MVVEERLFDMIVKRFECRPSGHMKALYKCLVHS